MLSAVEILVILGSVDEHYLRVFLGHKLWIDLFYGLGIMLYMGFTGTISGVIISTFSAFFMTLVLTAAAGIIGYRKRKVLSDGTVIWIDYPPKWTIASITELTKQLSGKVVNQCKEFQTKLDHA